MYDLDQHEKSQKYFEELRNNPESDDLSWTKSNTRMFFVAK
jgi:hypothetical protein